MPSYLHWVSFAHSVAQVGFVTSLFFGVILISMNLFLIKKVFGTYKYLMITFTLLGIVFASIELIIYPIQNVHCYRAGSIIYSSSEPFEVDKEVLGWGLEMYCGAYSATISFLAIQFCYRYWVVFDDSKLVFFRGYRSTLWILYCSFFSLQRALGERYLMNVDEEVSEYFRRELLQRYGVRMEDVSSRALLAYDHRGSIRWGSLLATLNMTSVMLVQYAVMVYCGWRMYSEMEEKLANYSAVMKRRNRQLLKTLILQISAPTLTLFSPIVILIYAPLLNLDISIPFGPMLCGFSLYPAMDAVIVLTVISEYRNAVKKLLFVKLKTLVEKQTGKESEENTTRKTGNSTLVY